MLALFATGAANDPPFGQAVAVDVRNQIPRGGFFGIGSDHFFTASVGAGGAEDALAPGEIDGGKTTAPSGQDAGFAGTIAIAATTAARNESGFFNRPRRTNRPSFTPEISPQKLCAANDLVHNYFTPGQLCLA
nr:hypothetical protein [Thiohalomonas denitrificans]